MRVEMNFQRLSFFGSVGLPILVLFSLMCVRVGGANLNYIGEDDLTNGSRRPSTIPMMAATMSSQINCFRVIIGFMISCASLEVVAFA
jgi:hypothetical protein